MKTRLLTACMCAASLLAAGSASAALTVTYTFEGTASGSLGGSAFANAALTVSLTGDTANIGDAPSPADVVAIDRLAGTLSVGGFLPTDFLNDQQVFANRTNESVGIRDIGLRADWLALTMPGVGLDGYGLDTGIGPLSDTTPFIDSGSLGPLNVPLAAGDLHLTSLSPLSFSAVAVPIPPVAFLFPAGLIAGIAWLRRAG